MSVTRQVPDAAGRFGPFGGRYVPETLTRALDQLTAEYEKAVGDSAFQAELDGLLAITSAGRRRCITPSGSAGSAAGADLPEARRPQPHRLAQDQQHARPGPA